MTDEPSCLKPAPNSRLLFRSGLAADAVTIGVDSVLACLSGLDRLTILGTGAAIGISGTALSLACFGVEKWIDLLRVERVEGGANTGPVE